jgi:hypothetical protein
MTPNYVTIVIAKFHTKKSKNLQILQLAICQLICKMYDWKYVVILVPASYVNVSENYNLHFAFYIISLLKFISFLNLYNKSSWHTYVLVYIKYFFILWESWEHCESFIEAVSYMKSWKLCQIIYKF